MLWYVEAVVMCRGNVSGTGVCKAINKAASKMQSNQVTAFAVALTREEHKTQVIPPSALHSSSST